MRLHQRITMAAVLLSTALTAMPGHADPKPLSMRTLAVAKDKLPDWYVASGNEQFEKLSWSTEQASAPIKTQADQELVLYTKETNKDGQPTFKEAQKVKVPESAEAILLLAQPVDNDEQAEVVAVADDIKNAKFNDWLLINRSKQLVSLRYGSDNEAVEVEPGESKNIQIKAEPGKGSEVIAQTKRGEKMRMIYSTYWAAQDKQRSLVLFYTKNERVKLQRIIDFLPAAEAQQP